MAGGDPITVVGVGHSVCFQFAIRFLWNRVRVATMICCWAHMPHQLTHAQPAHIKWEAFSPTFTPLVLIGSTYTAISCLRWLACHWLFNPQLVCTSLSLCALPHFVPNPKCECWEAIHQKWILQNVMIRIGAAARRPLLRPWCLYTRLVLFVAFTTDHSPFTEDPHICSNKQTLAGCRVRVRV